MDNTYAPPRWRWWSEWRVLVAAEVASLIGDQLAKISLALIVFVRSGSATWAGATYALTFLPEFVAGPVLAPLADRWPRRRVMIACALAQAACVAVMLLAQPVVLLAVAVATLAALTAPFKAAQAAAIVEILGAKQRAGQATMSIVREVGQLVGLGAAGGVIAAIGPIHALALDAASFLVVAALLSIGIRPRPAPAPPQTARGAVGLRQWSAGWRVIGADRRLVGLIALVVCVGVVVAPEAVLGPMIAELHAPPWSAGLLIAADSLGFVAVASLLTRLSPDRQRALLPLLPVLAALPLTVFALGPDALGVTLTLFLVGAGSSYLALSRGEVLDLVPAHVTAAVAGVVRTGLRGGQGVVALLAGWLAEHSTPSTAIAVLGVAGSTAVILIIVTCLRPRATVSPAQGHPNTQEREHQPRGP